MIELLVAMVISGILVAVTFQLLLGNSRFVRYQSATEEVQQNIRAAVDLISGELRSVPPQGIQEMGATQVRFYAPRAWGVLCNALSSTSTTAWVLFPAGVLPTEDFWNQLHWGIGVEQTTDPVVRTGQFSFVTQVTRQSTGDPCAAIQPNLTAQHIRLGFDKPASASFVASGTVPPGTPIALFEEIQYDVAESTDPAVPGWWIRRMVGYTSGARNMQPLAGPVPGAEGLQLTYLQSDGVTEATAAAQVRRVRLQVITQSSGHAPRNGVHQAQKVDTVSTEIFLRNFPG